MVLLEVVRFGNGVAIEVRDLPTRITVLYMVTSALQDGGLCRREDIPDAPPNLQLGTEMNDFEDQCIKVIDNVVDEKLRWLMLCTDVNILTEGETTEKFDALYHKTFHRDPECGATDPIRAECFQEIGLTHKQVIWMIDRGTKRVFCIHLQFAPPIYKTSLLAGVMLRHNTFQAVYRREEASEEAPVPQTDDEMLDDNARMLQRLRELLPSEIDQDTDTGVLESREVDVTEFIIKDAKMWCGSADGCFRGVWLAQQLNVWFNTPVTEDCWFRPTAQDPFTVTVGVWDEITTPHVANDAERWLALPAPTAQNTMWRYPYGDVMCGTPRGMLGIGHFLPHLDEDVNRWTQTHQLNEVRLFRLYKTQYPYVYSLMPDDDRKVRELKSKLKRSTESNPSLAEKGKEDVQSRLKISTDGPSGGSAKFTPLIATIPTLELERYVKAVFQQTPKYRYRTWWCAKYQDTHQKVMWIPVTPTN